MAQSAPSGALGFAPDFVDVGPNAATGAGNAETLNTDQGVITTEALATADGAVATRTLTNSKIKTTSQVLVGVVPGGTNTGVCLAFCSAVAAGSATIKLAPVSNALNGTVKYFFRVLP